MIRFRILGRWIVGGPTAYEVKRDAQAGERTGWAPDWQLPLEIAQMLPHTTPSHQRAVFTDKLRRLPMDVMFDTEQVDACVLRYLEATGSPMQALREARKELMRG